MSFGSRLSIHCGLFLCGIILLTDGAAIQGPVSMQPGMQRNSSESSPRPVDPRIPMSPDQQHRENPVPPPSLPFGINSMPPGFSFSSNRPMSEPPRMMMMPQQFSSPPNMNGPAQQQQQQFQQPPAQQPKREVPNVNSTNIPVPSLMNTNNSRGNNNTRREAEQTTTTTKPTVTTRKAFQEPPLGNDQKESDPSKKTQQMPPQSPFSIPVGQPPINPFFQHNPFFPSNPPIVFDQMGRPFMLVPVNSPFPMLQNTGPQGPPISPVPLGPFQTKPVGPVPFLVQPPTGNGDFGKQPPITPHANSDRNKNTTTTN